MDKWLKLAMEIQSLAQNGLTYSNNVFDTERYERLRRIPAGMISIHTELPAEKVQNLFCNETGYQTPKLDTRAAIFKNNQILLVHENNGTWSLPGGWVDVLESVRSNTIKEVKEETGLDAVAKRLIAVQDRNQHNQPVYAYGVCKIFVLCEATGGRFAANSETTETEYFSLDELPLLTEEKNTKAQIEMCFAAAQDETWQVRFD
jgi:ADP-ribose pyrophosphatase YjhB (NUDIX family)